MLTRIATAALAATLLGASAFALAPLEPVGPAESVTSSVTVGVTSAATPAGQTIIEKNSAWPLKQFMSMDPCTVTTCQEA